jgi:hypothetical protein
MFLGAPTLYIRTSPVCDGTRPTLDCQVLINGIIGIWLLVLGTRWQVADHPFRENSPCLFRGWGHLSTEVGVLDFQSGIARLSQYA